MDTLSLGAATESHGDSIQGYSHIQPITPRSEFYIYLLLNAFLLICPRALISLIRNNGNRPCPRCLIPKSKLQNLGMKLDIKHRKSMARVIDHRQKQKITTARSIIYEKGYAVDCEAVENILKEQSLVPNNVSLLMKVNCEDPYSCHWLRMLFRNALTLISA